MEEKDMEINITPKEEIEDVTIFINKPINDESEDIIGINSYAKRISKAIDEGANIIGVIGDYGTGKSSLIELIKKKYKEIININMWGSNKDNQSKDNIQALTKNFLFQMSMGKDETFAKYISKKLSKSYGMISIILSEKQILKKLIVPAIFLLLYMVLNNMPYNIYENSIYLNLHSIIDMSNQIFFKNLIIALYAILVNFKVVFLGLAIVSVIKLLLDKSILFSLWDSQGKREPNENDLDDIYIEIANKLTENLKDNEKKIIIIDDLDRENNKQVVKDFIREIYKFNSVLKDEIREKIVFIIEVKAEESLEEIDKVKNKEEKSELYKKAFYFKVNLNTIHFNDYERVVLGLLKQKQQKGERILKKEINDKLPEEFAYITKGENLTIRDIKERLNRSFEIYENLKSKSNDSIDTIEYRKCAIVAYLENKYPKEMSDFIKEEENFKNLLEKAYVVKQESNISNKDRQEKIIKLIGSNGDKFSSEIAEMIISNLIDEDFRLYFYNYPKGQKIKTSDEVYVEDVILYPDKVKDIDDSKIQRALKRDNRIIYRSFERRMNEKLPFSRNIFENETLYKVALKSFYYNIMLTLKEDVKWKMENIEESGRIINKISNYNVNSEKILMEYAEYLKDDLKKLTYEETITARKKILESINSKYILCFKNIFVNKDIPIISKEELLLINDTKIKLQLINESIVNTKNIEYIVETINQEKLAEEDFKRAVTIYMGIDKNLKLETIPNKVLEFLKINNKPNNLLFDSISQAFIKNREKVNEIDIVTYLNELNVEDISVEYLENINAMLIKRKLSDNILNLLKENDLHETLWINLISQNRSKELDLENNIDENISLIKKIFNVIKEQIILLRKDIIKKEISDKYKMLFVMPYPIITKDEVDLLNNINLIKELTDFNRIKENEIEYIVNKINSIEYTANDLIEIVKILDRNISTGIKDINLIRNFFDKLKIKKENVLEIKDEDKSYIYRVLREPLMLTDFDNAINFSLKIGYIIKEIDIQLNNNIPSNYNINLPKYIELINNIDIATEQTIKNITSLMSNQKEFKLNENILQKLLELEKFKEYIIGKTIKNDNIILELDKVDLKNYIEVYNNSSVTYEIMKRNEDFLKLIIDNKAYDKIKKEKLPSFYKFSYSIDFIRYLFDTLSKNEVLEYVKNDLKCEKTESYKLRNLVCEDKYIWIVETDEIYDIIRNILIDPSDKSQLTRARNKKYKNK